MKPRRKRTREPAPRDVTQMRIIGGHFRGRLIKYHGDRRVRPMKDRIREAVFNLIGPAIKEKYAIDLFAGTGALGLEALSRGAVGATFVERHYPTARLIEENIAALDVGHSTQVITSDTFFWVSQTDEHATDSNPWCIFCCPPYRLYLDRTPDVRLMLDSLILNAPNNSILVVETGVEFDLSQLAIALPGEVRQYAPATVACYRKSSKI